MMHNPAVHGVSPLSRAVHGVSPLSPLAHEPPGLIEEELARTQSPEVRARLGRIVATAAVPPSDAQRIEQQTRRILQIIAEREKSR